MTTPKGRIAIITKRGKQPLPKHPAPANYNYTRQEPNNEYWKHKY